VTEIPYLTPAATVIATVATETGLTQAQVAADLGIADGDLVNATGESEVETAIVQIQHGQTPTPLTDSGFLTASEVTQVQTTIDQYNSAITQEVAAVGGILVDIHSYFQASPSTTITRPQDFSAACSAWMACTPRIPAMRSSPTSSLAH
jgi:hypothetical protein